MATHNRTWSWAELWFHQSMQQCLYCLKLYCKQILSHHIFFGWAIKWLIGRQIQVFTLIRLQYSLALFNFVTWISITFVYWTTVIWNLMDRLSSQVLFFLILIVLRFDCMYIYQTINQWINQSIYLSRHTAIHMTVQVERCMMGRHGCSDLVDTIAGHVDGVQLLQVLAGVAQHAQRLKHLLQRRVSTLRG